jgi:2-haloacid dehalogenase
MAKPAGRPGDCVLSAEIFCHYKPDRETYLGCADILGVAPDEVMMVAAHPADLRAARDAGLRTGFVFRPAEHGPDRVLRRPVADEFDIVAKDFGDLADQLGA